MVVKIALLCSVVEVAADSVLGVAQSINVGLA